MRTVLLAIAFALAGAATAEARPVVLELFTSQGCSSCPKANALAEELDARDDVLAMSLAVDYWDYLGWRDTFADPAFSERQRNYAMSLDNRQVYTPQMVIDGAIDVRGGHRDEVEAAIVERTAARIRGPRVRLTSLEDVLVVQISSGMRQEAPAEVWLFEVQPGARVVEVDRGENRGKSVRQFNVVRKLTYLGPWTGAPTRFAVPPPELGEAVVLVQSAGLGPILGVGETLSERHFEYSVQAE